MNMEAPTPAGRGKPGNAWTTSSWDQQPQATRRTGPLEWWHKLAAPVEPKNATPHDREVVRAGRLSSVILLMLIGFGWSLLPNAIFSANRAFLPILVSSMIVNWGMVYFNRQGKIILVGLILVIVVELCFIAVVLTSPTGLTPWSMTTFNLIAVTELIAVSLLPPKSVFLVALCNAIFTWIAVTFLHHRSDFIMPTVASYYSILMEPIVLQFIVAIVTYLWVQGATQAIARAEQVAALERVMAEKDRAIAEQKQQLDQGIQQILQTHVQVANGDLNARAPLARENVLWQVAHNLNNLLARLQRSSQIEQELQRTSAETTRLATAVRNAKAQRRPIQVARSGTVLDPLAQELTGNYIGQP
ncbi:MAG: hypothetical protein H0W02_23750 [Ktedonobacteraceae bacterium]|nr:hypothetical protein [Ktedonobacteraceae bacterium]